MTTKHGTEPLTDAAEQAVESATVGVEPPVACVIQVAFDDNGMPYADIEDANVRPGDHVIWTTYRNDQRCFRIRMEAPVAYAGDPPQEAGRMSPATRASGCSGDEEDPPETPPGPGDAERNAPSVRVSTVRFRINSAESVFYPYRISPCDGPGADEHRAFMGRIIVRPPPRPK